jgi:hypothetical protein
MGVLSLPPWLLLVFRFTELLLMPELGFITEGPALRGGEVVLHRFWVWIGCRMVLASVEFSR